jgi:hypothetical protein
MKLFLEQSVRIHSHRTLDSKLYCSHVHAQQFQMAGTRSICKKWKKRALCRRQWSAHFDTHCLELLGPNFNSIQPLILAPDNFNKGVKPLQWTSDIRTSDIRTLAYRDTPKHVPAKVVLCYPRLLTRTLAYKDTKMLVPAVSLYPRFTVIIVSIQPSLAGPPF